MGGEDDEEEGDSDEREKRKKRKRRRVEREEEELLDEEDLDLIGESNPNWGRAPQPQVRGSDGAAGARANRLLYRQSSRG